MAKRIIRLTEADIENIVRKVIQEQQDGYRERSVTSEEMNKGDNPELMATRKEIINQALKGEGEYAGYTAVEATFTPLNIGLAIGNPALMWLRRNPSKKTVELYKKGNYERLLGLVNGLTDYMDEESKKEFENLKEKNPIFYGYMTKKVSNLLTILNNSTNKSKNCIVYSTGTQSNLIPADNNQEFELEVFVTEDNKTSYANKFVTGSAEISPQYAENYKNDLLTQFGAALNQMRESYKDDTSVSFPGGIYIKGIEIISSSSKVPQDNMRNERYRTGPNGTPDGYQNLADDRANSMKELIEGIISSNSNIVMAPGADIKIDSKGAQGPEWKGKMGPEYLEHQKAIIKIKFQVPAERKTEPEIELPRLTTEDGFAVVVTGKRRKDFTPGGGFGSFKLNGNPGIFKRIITAIGSLFPIGKEKCPAWPPQF